MRPVLFWTKKSMRYVSALYRTYSLNNSNMENVHGGFLECMFTESVNILVTAPKLLHFFQCAVN